MTQEEKEELFEEIETKIKESYEIEEGDRYSLESGCYVNGEWLSISDILDLVKEAIQEHY